MRLRLPLFLLALLPAFPRAETAGPAPAAAEESAAELHRKSREAWSRRKTSTDPWLYLGRARQAEGRPKRALKAFAKALKVNPQSAEAYRRRGHAFERMGKMDEAANEYQAALKASPKDAEARADWERLSAALAPPSPQ